MLKPFERTPEPFKWMSQYFELMLMYFEQICKSFERFVICFEWIFLGVRTDDKQIKNSLPVQTDNPQCPFCLLRSHIMHVYSENIQLLCAYFRVVMLMMFSFKMLLTDSGGIFLKSWQITLPWLSFISNTALTSSPQ